MVLIACRPWLIDGFQARKRCNDRVSVANNRYLVSMQLKGWFHSLFQWMQLFPSAAQVEYKGAKGL